MFFPPQILVRQPLRRISSGGGTVTVDATGTAALNNATAGALPNFTTLTIGASATALVVPIMIEEAVANIGTISMTWNGVSLTQLTTPTSTVSNNGSNTVVIFGMVSPATGNQTLAISWNGTASTAQAMYNAVSFNGTAGTLAGAFPAGSRIQDNTFNTTVCTLSPTTGTGHFMVASWGSNNDAFSSVSGTQLFKPGGPSINFGAGNYTDGSVGSISATAATTSPVAGCAIDVSP